MSFRDIPIQKKIIRVLMITSGSVLLLTCSAYFAYEFFTFRSYTVRQLAILGEIVSENSTAALAFDSEEDAYEILSSIKAQPDIIVAALYDKEGNLFTSYPEDFPVKDIPEQPEKAGYRFKDSHLAGFQPIKLENNHLGTLYLRSNMEAMYTRLQLYGITALLVVVLSFILAYLLSRKMQTVITRPILMLAETAKAISNQKNYSVRANKLGEDEFGLLTDAFNHMLDQIQKQNQEIKLFNQNLEQKIAERTFELETANKELESFSYSVSHDLRAPLRAIDGYSKILLKKYADSLDKDGNRFLNVITSNAMKMGDLIDDLLAFSRVGKQNLEKVTLDMHAIALHAVEEIKEQENYKASINVKDMLPVKGDYSMMKQVVTNLVSNALKYSKKSREPIIEIGSYRNDHQNIYYVQDNGVGFDMQFYNKLFGVFQRLHNTDEFEGTGVGLALVHRIITKHEGKVWAEGEVDKGAVFYFSIPNH